MKKTPLTITLASVLICVVLVVIPHLLLIFIDWDWVDLLIRGVAAAFIGVLIAPEIEREAFKKPVLFQSVSGFFAGGFVGYAANPVFYSVAGGMATGLVLGFTARWWVKEIRLP